MIVQRQLFKGAYFWDDSGVYKLTTTWSDWAIARAGIAALGDTRIGKWLAWNLWDMYRREMNWLEVDLRGMAISSKTYLHTLHRVPVSGSTEATTNKVFLLRPIEMDWYTMQWR